jgi:hypothetical protein
MINTHSEFYFHVVSGSITSRDAISALTGDPTGNKGCTLSDLDRPYTMACVTTIDDETALQAFADYVEIRSTDEEKKEPQLAIVSEGDTDYGHIHIGEAGDVLQLHFPRGLSRLRAAYQENPGMNAGSKGTVQALRQLLPLNLTNEPNFDEDHVPGFSTVQTPSEQESQVLQLAATLRWRHIKYAVIAATDPLDSMFVIRLLNTGSPDTRLAVLGPDLLYLRVLDDLPLEGMPAITYSPLSPATQRWFDRADAPEKSCEL